MVKRSGRERGSWCVEHRFHQCPLAFGGMKMGENFIVPTLIASRIHGPTGDYGELTSSGGVIIHGRSDAVLNPGGVRIGTAEIYRQVEKLPQVIDCLCIGQDWQDDVRVVLFVVLQPEIDLDEELTNTIKSTIQSETTPRHVPRFVIQVPDIPRTISGKIVELAVRNVVHGLPVKNTDALANPEALAFFRDQPLLQMD